MPQENVAIARKMIDCVNRGDDERLADLMAVDVECFPAVDQPEPPFRGRDAFVEYIRGWTQAFEPYAVEASEYLDVGGHVVIVGRIVARGRGSGVETTSDGDAWVLRVRDGRVIEYREFDRRQDALEAVQRRTYGTGLG
jgi:ketosteroid isomerase-like protein